MSLDVRIFGLRVQDYNNSNMVIEKDKVLSTCFNHFIPIIVGVGKRGAY